jgi:hypothetical protein
MVDIAVACDSPEDMAEQLEAFANSFPQETSEALWEELTVVMNESKPLVPVDMGYLRGSGYVTDPVIMADGTIAASIGYSAEYAAAVHEILWKFHRPPTQAKFLEQPLVLRAKYMIEFIVRRVNSKIGGTA